ncbi:hypothetical protein [Extensimonas perlucida]|nr:hypothetical protein [Extensimonas perlucida]
MQQILQDGCCTWFLSAGGKKWAAAAHSQPTIPKSDRLPAPTLAP